MTLTEKPLTLPKIGHIMNGDTPSRDDLRFDILVSEEKLLKRFRNLKEGLVEVLILDGKPKYLVVNGKLEVLG